MKTAGMIGITAWLYYRRVWAAIFLILPGIWLYREFLEEESKKKEQSLYSNAILLTTGATEATNLQNIYDIAGNVWEWTLERCKTSYPYTFRGGSYENSGSSIPAGYRNEGAINNYRYNIGFRIGLWK